MHTDLAHCSIRSLYPEFWVHVAGYMSGPFPVRVTLRQGCPLSPVLVIMFMDRISRRSQVAEGVGSGDRRTPSMPFADGVALLASSNHYLQPAGSGCPPLGLRVSFSVSKGWTAHSLSVKTCFHKWSSLSASGSYLRVMGEWKD